MFVATFAPTTGSPFTSDKNGNMPFIGTILAGTSRGALINGTMFTRDGRSSGKMYFCENFEEEYEGKTLTRVRIIAEVSVVEYLTLRTQLGTGKLSVGAVVAEVEETEVI